MPVEKALDMTERRMQVNAVFVHVHIMAVYELLCKDASKMDLWCCVLTSGTFFEVTRY